MVKAYIDSLRTDRTKRTRLALLVAIIAVVIFAAVLWTMRFIGITMTDEAGCGMLEHTHTEECYERVLICKTPEGEEHTHTDECYEMVLICGKEEHTHTALCYPDTSADVESPEDWEATLPASDNMTGDWAKDLVAVARSQVGYRESERNYNLNEDGSHSGYTRFGAWYGSPYIDWNAPFIAFCLNYAKIPAGVIPYNSGVEAMITACDASKIISSVEGYSPAAGDIAFIDSDGDGKADSVAVISSVLFDDADSASALTTTTGTASGKNKNTSASTPAPIILVAVEGDIDGEVKENIYTYSESGVLGFLNMEELREKYIENTPEPTEEPQEPGGKEEPSNTQDPIEATPAPLARSVVNGRFYNVKQVNVSLGWDSSDTSHSSVAVTATLYRYSSSAATSGTSAGTATLNSSNNWSYSFTSLSNSYYYEVEYTLADGYVMSPESTSGSYDTWVPATSFTSSGTYAFVHREGSAGDYKYYALASKGSYTAYSSSSLYYGYLGVSVVDLGLNGYPTNIPELAQWTASRTGNYANLKNVGSSRTQYLYRDALTIDNSEYIWYGTDTNTDSIYFSAGSGDYNGYIHDGDYYLYHAYYDGDTDDTSGYTMVTYDYFGSSSSAMSFGLFRKSSTVTAGSVVISMEKITEMASIDQQLSHNKRIDWLGDEGTDSSSYTDASGEDLYRLYLDVTGKSDPVDMMLIIDRSGSMKTSDMQNSSGTSITRIQAVMNFLNGETSSSTGFMEQFINANPYNQLAIVSFSDYENGNQTYAYEEDSTIVRSWGRDYSNVSLSASRATDYNAAIFRADDLLNLSSVANNGHRKVIVFLSDGEPTQTVTSKTQTKPNGTGASGDIIIYNDTITAISDFCTAHPDVEVNTVAFYGTGDDFEDAFLRYFADQGNGSFCDATSSEALANAINSAMFPTYTSVTDTLSAYVDYYTADPDLIVTRTYNGNTTVIWRGSDPGTAANGGANYIDSVTYDSTTKQIKLVFKPDYQLTAEETFTVSFNVQRNSYANTEYTNNHGYSGMVGDYLTDYGENSSSSDRPGFFANASASLDYSLGGNYYSEAYRRPVVQAEGDDSPSDPGNQDATFQHDKVIDWLGDGQNNPDTSLTGDNMYRLYLDWTGEFSKPYDLMLVIDRSASMLYAPDGSTATTSNPSRETLVERVLNGYGSDAGLIKTFLDANPQNRISIVTFGGEPEERMDISSWSSATSFTNGGIYTLTDDGYYMAASTSGTSITYTSSLTDYAKWVAYESSTSGYFFLKNVATGDWLNYSTSSPFRLYTSDDGCFVRLYNSKLYVSTGESLQYYVYHDSSYGYVISTSSTTFTGKKANLASYSYEIDSAAPRGWGRNYDAFYLNVQDNTGTNYEAGLLKAQEKWASSANPNKLMIFLSDGEPTYWVKSNGDRGGTGVTTYSNLHGTSENGSIYESKLAWDVFHSACPTVTTRALLFGSAMNQETSFSTGFAYTFRNTSGTNLTIANNSTWYYYVDSSNYPYLRTGNGSGNYLNYNGSSFSTTSRPSSATYFRLNSKTGYLQYYVSSSETWANTSYDSSYIKAFRPLDMSALNYIDDTGVAATIESDNTGAYQALLNTLSSFIYPSNVVITDTLSKYVRFDQSYGGDLKVTRVNKTTGVIEDLYIWPNVTAAGGGIIDTVTYTEGDSSNEPTGSTGTITVNFVDGFTVDPNYKYTLSFNVSTTKTAENEKTANEAANREPYSVLNPNYDANDPESSRYIQYTGDLGTDFVYTPNGLVNTSSSTMPGFRSNQEATVSMTLGGTEITENYDHPVVQVNSTSGGSETVENFEKSKTIDWLGDGEENPDTDLTGEEYYRLYLNWSGEFSVPYDLLIVVDTSGSMLDVDGVDGTTNPSSGNSREEIVESVLNGTNGIIRKFLNANDDNRVALIKFDGTPNAASGYTYMSDSSLLRTWGRDTADVDLGVVSNRGTNYAAGLRLARTVLNNSPHQNKIMVFLSDGVPTYWLVSDNERGGTGYESDSTNVTNARTHTIDYAEDFKDLFPNVPMYGILFNSQSGVDTSALAAISTSDQAYTATSGEQLVNLFNMATSPSNMKIVDYLSQYVECNEQLGGDIVVTCVNKTTGDIEVLFDDGAITTAGTGIIKPGYPKYTAWANMTADEQAAHPSAECTGKIELQFVDGFAIDPNLEYTLSFNVRVTQTAKDEKAAKVAYYEGYVKGDPTVTVNGTTYHLFNEDGSRNTEVYELLDETTNPTKAEFDAICNLYCPEETTDASNYIGDPGTDYAYNANGIVNNNSTSSLMPGFRSNDQATVSYTFGTEHSEEYDHPVVQVTVENEEKEDTNFHNSKVIDWLGDYDDNPDTDVDDEGGASAETLENLYRLYLDMSGKQNKGCDLMIIVDQSNSMNEEISSGYTRIDAVNDVLWGKVVSGSRSGGLVKDFLDANDGKNRICILGFGGAYTNQSNTVVPYPYANDTTTFRMWGRDATPIEISAPTNWGTNYCAALRLAQDAWDQVYADNTNKLMIFLSDGEPSFYMRNTSDGLRRYGNGTSTYINSTTDGYTMSFYDTFRTGYPKVHTESVGFGSTFNTTVLNYFAKNGDPSSSAVALRATDYESLLAALKAQIYPSSIVISDALSKYVRYYSPDADMKVTMKREIGKDATTGDPIYEEATIFENGAIVASAPVYVNGADTGDTVNGADFLRRVSYTEGDNRPAPEESTGTVEVEFNPEFVADPSYTFTVSFNVIATQTAYNAEQNGAAHNIGDEDTDYPGNNTSSGKPGYFSNDSASRVTYNIGSATQEDPYDKPVIQGPTVEPPELGSSGATATAAKTWDDENDKYQLRPEYVTVRLYADGQPTGKTAQLSEDNNWTYTWTDLPAYAEDGVTLIQYSIEEDYVYGYTPTYAEPTFTTTGEREFKLIYYPNEGTGTAVEETYNESTSFTTTAKAPAALGFSRAGYNFTGWNTKPDGSGTSYAVGATVSLANGGIALYAQWEQDSSVNTYTITFRRNGATSGYLAPVTVTTAAGQTSASYTLPDPGNTYTYEGYAFAGWAMGSASGSVYQAGATVTISADTTFYATWTQTVSDLDRAMNVSGGTLHFESTDTYPWTTGTSGEHFYGTSGNAGQNSTSSNVTTTVTLTEASTLTFEYYYSSESNYDKCYFYIDGTVQSDLNGLSGSSSGWKVATYTLSAGTHTLKWTFTKDYSIASGKDQFWVDNVAITAGSSSSVTWTEISTLTTGKSYTVSEGYYYRFVSNDDAYALANVSGTAVTREANDATDPAQWWIAYKTTINNGAKTVNYFKNAKTGNYLYYTSTGSSSSDYDYVCTHASDYDTYVLYAVDTNKVCLMTYYYSSSSYYSYYLRYLGSTASYRYIFDESSSNGVQFSVYYCDDPTGTSGSVLPTPNESVGELSNDVWNRITVDTTDANFFLLNGKTVVLTNGQGLALANDAGTTVNFKAVNEDDPAQQWVVSADVNSATFALRNVKTGYYLNYVTTRGEIFFTADAQNAAHSKLHSVSPNTFRLGKFDASDDTLALCSEILTVYQHKTAFNPDPDSAGDGSGKVGGDDDQHIDFSDIIPEETEPPVGEHIEHSDIVPVTSQQPAVSDSNSASAPTKAGQGNGTKANSTYTLASELEVGSRYLIVTKYGNNYYVLKNTEYSSNSCPETTSVSISSNSITGDYTDYQFLVGGSAGAYTFYNENNQKYLGLNSSTPSTPYTVNWFMGVTNKLDRKPLQVDKHVAGVNGPALYGAQFTLVRADESFEPYVDTDHQYLAFNAISDVYGRVIFSDGNAYGLNCLPYGNYVLTEVSAPDGHEIVGSGVWHVIVDENGARVVDENGWPIANDSSNKPAIVNMPTYELAETGGMGVYGFTAVGGMLMLVPAVYAIVDRRRRKRSSN